MDKVVFIVTHGKDDLERASLPFVLGNAALASDIEVVYFLQSDAVLLAKKSFADGLKAEGLDPIKTLIDSSIEGGARIYLCSPCCASRGITKDDIIEGAEIASGVKLIDESIGSTVFTY